MAEKIKINNNVFVYPMPVTLVGTKVGEKVNFMTLGWVSRVNANPPLLGVGIGKTHFTPDGILENKSFSVNFPGSEMMEIADYCGIVSGEKVDKSGLFEIFYGELETAPMIKACPLNLECRLVETMEFPTNYFFVGEIIGAYSEEQYMTQGKPDVKKIDPLVLTMPDNSYWTVGDYAGKAWGSGKAVKERLKTEE